jgi:hypothetical protein
LVFRVSNLRENSPINKKEKKTWNEFIEMIKMLALNVSPMLSSGNEISQENRKPYLRKSKSLKDPCEEKEFGLRCFQRVYQ